MAGAVLPLFPSCARLPRQEHGRKPGTRVHAEWVGRAVV